MVISINVVQNEHLFVPIGQLIDSSLQIDSVNQATQPEVRPTHLQKWFGVFLFWFGCLVERYFGILLLPKSHKHDVDGQSVQPSGKARVTAKSLNLAERLQECLLGQVFSFGWVVHHTQAEMVYSPTVQLMKVPERSGVALLCQLNGLLLRQAAGVRFR